MSDKSDAIAVMETVRAETLDAISGIPGDKMTVAAFGTWSVKDVLCHLASWEQFAVPDLQRISRGHIPQLATLRLEEVDEWNAGLMRSRNLFSLPQAKFELEESRHQFIDALNAQPEGGVRCRPDGANAHRWFGQRRKGSRRRNPGMASATGDIAAREQGWAAKGPRR